MNNLRKGFTLIELLVVIGIIIILTSIVLVAVNPGRQFAQARNAQRKSDLIAISNAVYAFAAEHNGDLPDNDNDDMVPGFPIAPICIGSDAVAGCFNLATAGAQDTDKDVDTDIDEPIVPTYIADIPVDPSVGAADGSDTGYTIYLDAATTRITIAAPGAELGQVLSITK